MKTKFLHTTETSSGRLNGNNWEYDEVTQIGDVKKDYYGILRVDSKWAGNTELWLLDPKDCELDHHNVWYSLSDFFVSKKFRGKGFGRVMLQRLLEFAKGKNRGILKRIDHSENASLDDMRGFLLANGFFEKNGTLYMTPDGQEVVE